MIIAPSATDEAIDIIAGKKNLRLLVTGGCGRARAPALPPRPWLAAILVHRVTMPWSMTLI